MDEGIQAYANIPSTSPRCCEAQGLLRSSPTVPLPSHCGKKTRADSIKTCVCFQASTCHPRREHPADLERLVVTPSHSPTQLLDYTNYRHQSNQASVPKLAPASITPPKNGSERGVETMHTDKPSRNLGCVTVTEKKKEKRNELFSGDTTPETMERAAGRNEESVKADLCAQNFPFKLQHQSWI